MIAAHFRGLTVCLGLACLMLTGRGALAGTTTATEATYAREVGTPGATYTLPGTTATRTMNVIRGVSQDFALRVSLGQKALFVTGRFPAAGDLTLTTTGGGAVATSIVGGGTNGDAFVTYLVDVTTGFTSFPTFTLTTTGWTIIDGDNVLGGGGTITLTLETRDSASDLLIDPGTDTQDWLKSAFGVTVASALSPTTAAIDFTTTSGVADQINRVSRLVSFADSHRA